MRGYWVGLFPSKPARFLSPERHVDLTSMSISICLCAVGFKGHCFSSGRRLLGGSGYQTVSFLTGMLHICRLPLHEKFPHTLGG